MTARRLFTARAFIESADRLDERGLRLYQEHGRFMDGRRAFVEQIVDDAMFRLAFGSSADVDHG